MLKHISHEKIKIQHMSISLILSKSARDKVNKIARCHSLKLAVAQETNAAKNSSVHIRHDKMKICQEKLAVKCQTIQ